MSRTYRHGADERIDSDGRRNYSTPRYRPGSRSKPHQIVAIGVHRDQPDVTRLARAIARLVLEQEVHAKRCRHGESDGGGAAEGNTHG